ncbi:MAG: fumarylacetoacetase [Mesorhizobium sp.]|nr:fumarylacetoacetase [Mesorhizobium sp.]MCO5162243.1 fumarylacetoacetase [Mesorhizobium sp.]
MTGLLRSWIASANSETTDFPLNNLPYGVFSGGQETPRCGVAIGDLILDVTGLERAGLIGAPGAPDFQEPAWNTFMRRGPGAWRVFRARLTELLIEGSETQEVVAPFLVPMNSVKMHLPFEVTGFTDFFANLDHATNAGTIFRGPSDAVASNWYDIPVGYNGRAVTVYVSGTPIRRPLGQVLLPGSERPVLMPEPKLDYELELGAVVGTDHAGFQPVNLADADAMIFGYVLVNDWSARGIQAWEARPLGPFLAKSFATSISPWVVPAAALAPFRCPPPSRVHPLLPYLSESYPTHFDIEVEARMKTQESQSELVIATTNYRRMYFSLAQQLCHHMINGTAMRAGDLLGSGTISGPAPENRGCLLERTWNGTEALTFPDGTRRTFLEDGDEIALTGRALGGDYRIGFGECRGRILKAPIWPAG